MRNVWSNTFTPVRRLAVRVAILVLTLPINAASALVWRLEAWRARLQTALNNHRAR
jgi:hypothetical protein